MHGRFWVDYHVQGLCGNVEDLVEFKQNKDYTLIIVKQKCKTNTVFFSQKIKNLPTSNQAAKAECSADAGVYPTPQQEPEQALQAMYWMRPVEPRGY